MDISGEWRRPIDLSDDQIGYSTDLDGIPNGPGIYVFGCRWGDNVCPLYIGQSLNLRLRMKQHFDSLYLMKAIRSFPNGQRKFDLLYLQPSAGQRIEKVLDVVERGLNRPSPDRRT